jgi:hypothetical protein
MQGLQQQRRHRNQALCFKRFRRTAAPAACKPEDCNGLIAQCMEAVALELHRNRAAAIEALALVRRSLSQGTPNTHPAQA